MADELRYETGSGVLARMLGGGRSAVSAFVAGLVGAAAFSASLVADWQTMTLATDSYFIGDGSPGSLTLTTGVDISGYAVPYQVGVLGLLTLLGALVARPELARRLRLAAAALGVGVVGVLAAIVSGLGQEMVASLFGLSTSFGGYPVPTELQNAIDDAVYATEPGVYFAFGSVAALVAGAWLAAGSPRDAAGSGAATAVASAPAAAVPPFVVAPSDPTSADAAPVSPSPVGPPGLPLDRPGVGTAWPPAQVGHADGLTVTASDAIDPGAQPDILRN